MSKFSLLTPPYLIAEVAEPVAQYLRQKYGTRGLKIEASFSPHVGWRPTIQIQSSTTELILVEVAEIIYPQIFRTSYPEILNGESVTPIRVYQACPLSVFQNDPGQKQIRSLRAHGFGMITTNGDLQVEEQFSASTLIYHVPQEKFESSIRGTSSDVKAALARAFDVYRTDAKQGLQASGQIVEALIHSIASFSSLKTWLAGYRPANKAADVIDKLYASTSHELKVHRASFGGARQFMKTYRNPSSHPTKSKSEAKEKAKNIKEGFESSLSICSDLVGVRKSIGCKSRITV